MDNVKYAFAEKLLKIRAIKLQPNEPFQWASGWNSPIYTDNRLVLSYPDVRAFVKTELTHAVLAHFPEATAVAGVATGAIAMGMAVADLLQLPYAYVRPKPKDHGTKSQIEGRLPEGSKVVVVEDLISTGSSSLKAVEALRTAGFETMGILLKLPHRLVTFQKTILRFCVSGAKTLQTGNEAVKRYDKDRKHHTRDSLPATSSL